MAAGNGLRKETAQCHRAKAESRFDDDRPPCRVFAALPRQIAPAQPGGSSKCRNEQQEHFAKQQLPVERAEQCRGFFDLQDCRAEACGNRNRNEEQGQGRECGERIPE